MVTQEKTGLFVLTRVHVDMVCCPAAPRSSQVALCCFVHFRKLHVQGVGPHSSAVSVVVDVDVDKFIFETHSASDPQDVDTT